MSRARDFADLAGSADAGGLTGRNLVINGSFAVSQRATSVTGVTGDGYQAVDRWKTAISSAGAFTVSQAADGPAGFSTCHKFDCTTAKSSLDAGNYILFFQTIEARNLQSLGFGASGAKQITLSFYVKSNKTGTYIAELALGDATNASNNSQAYTINSANTWERKTLTYAAQTVDVINNDSGEGMNIFFWLGAGSQWSGGTLNPNVWANTAAANRAAGQVNLADSTSNEWSITGVQLELGDKTTPFEHRSFGEELALCQRYFWRISGYDSAGVQYPAGANVAFSTSAAALTVIYPVPMRAKPSFTADANTICTGVACYNATGQTLLSTTVLAALLQINTSASSFDPEETNFSYFMGQNSNAFIAFDAEL